MIIIILLGINSFLLLIVLLGIFSNRNKKLQDSFLLKVENIMLKNNNELGNHINKSFAEQSRVVHESLQHMTRSISSDLSKQTDSINNKLSVNIENLMKNVNEQMDKINVKVEDRLRDGFNKTNETFVNILTTLATITEAQKKIDGLSTEIVSLQDILTDKKTRGVFGEVKLEQILFDVFGEANKGRLFDLQYQLKNNTRPDAVLILKEPLGVIPIDSKFPLENYRRTLNKELTAIDLNIHKKAFVSDVKKHVDDIAQKYVKADETSSHAILFIPAEAIFAEINAYYPEILIYANKHSVWLASPTTLMALLTTIQLVNQDIERSAQASIIKTHLEKLSIEFHRYNERWEALSRSINKVYQDTNEINITNKKISLEFDKINKVQFLSSIPNNID